MTNKKSTPSRYNVALLQKVRDIIDDESKHQQGSWAEVPRTAYEAVQERVAMPGGTEAIPVSCGTAACVAGWAVQLQGDRLLVSANRLRSHAQSAEASAVLTDDGEVLEIGGRAAELLGLDSRESSWLFSPNWSNEEVLDHLDALIAAAKHGVDWEFDDDPTPYY